MTTIDKFTYPWPTPLTESWPVFFDNHLATHHDVWRGPLGIEGLRSLYRTCGGRDETVGDMAVLLSEAAYQHLGVPADEVLEQLDQLGYRVTILPDMHLCRPEGADRLDTLQDGRLHKTHIRLYSCQDVRLGNTEVFAAGKVSEDLAFDYVNLSLVVTP